MEFFKPTLVKFLIAGILFLCIPAVKVIACHAAFCLNQFLPVGVYLFSLLNPTKSGGGGDFQSTVEFSWDYLISIVGLLSAYLLSCTIIFLDYRLRKQQSVKKR